MSISVEVMDSTHGRPAAGVPVGLWRESDARWHKQAGACTDESGRIARLGVAGRRGRYRLVVDLDPYFAGFGVMPFQSRVEVVFRVFRPGDPVRLLLMVTSSSCGTHIVLSGDHDGYGRSLLAPGRTEHG